ncbi:ABC transporter permease [Guptibacillus hwajinpoensis]|uniref:ABC transport system permease protein n=1 Tax=Guptibacillus hwajinpoensis TaxID=208199 RepID=A0ABU0K5I8_9BACL|nr:ABC transporter permease [Alkalihalobacillus hemicentroti]MDQ0484621.1 putative ABC transport system permease protein [Alkalihalobacillus hemicentroti]
MSSAMFGAVESGIIYAIMALGVYLSFRILDFPDLTVDGSFVTGAAITAILIVNGTNPFFATLLAIGAGFIAGCITGLLHTKGKINPLLAGILMMIALYSINLRIMGRSNVPLLNEESIFTKIEAFFTSTGLDALFASMAAAIGLQNLTSTWSVLISMLVVTALIKVVTDLFLRTQIGLALRATGDNKRMIRSFSANTDQLTILGLGLSNALVALAGALIAQYSSFADVGMGIGMIIIGLASVIIGEAIFGTKTIAVTTFAVVGGAIVYRIVVSLALRVDFLETGDMKLITAVIVIAALVLPQLIDGQKERRRKKKKRLQQETKINEMKKGGEGYASTKSNSQSI